MLSGTGVVVRRVVCGVVFAVGLVPLPLSAQGPGAAADPYVPTMTFDVASVRESKLNPQGDIVMSGWFQPNTSSHLHLQNWSMENLLIAAYSTADWPLHFNDIDGGDLLKQMSRSFFNVDAKADEESDAHLTRLKPEERLAEQRHMVRALLADRFKLKVHWEDRPARTYDLVVAKPGRLVSIGAPGEDELKAFGDRPIPPLYQRGSSVRGFEYIAHGATTTDIAEMLTGQFGEKVNDKSGLTGKYDFHLETYGVRAEDRKMDETNPWPPLENAVEDQLGLKLVRSKGLVRVLVIDHVERPSEN